MEPVLTAKNIRVVRHQKTVLQVEDLQVFPGEVLAVIGPNGAGKSTLLLALSTLIQSQMGEIRFRGMPLIEKNKLDYRRRIGVVMQDPLLLDSSVEDNVSSGLRFRHLNKAEIQRRVSYWLEKLEIAHLQKRKARQLSGGEAQRVSLARALALEPSILFLDEPFGALDAPTRTRLLLDFQRLQREQKTTTLFVTHDLDEALLLADRVAVVMAGELRQVGKPQHVFTGPVDREIAQFVGVETIIPGIVRDVQEGLALIQVNGFILEAVGEVQIGQTVFICLRSEDVTLWLDDIPASSARNHLRGNVHSKIPNGPLERIIVDCGGFWLTALITRNSAKEMNIEPGQRLSASFKASAAHLIVRQESER